MLGRVDKFPFIPIYFRPITSVLWATKSNAGELITDRCRIIIRY